MVPLTLEAADITEVSLIAQRTAFCPNFQQRAKNTVGTIGPLTLPTGCWGPICGQFVDKKIFFS
jgi:hypothetical protein